MQGLVSTLKRKYGAMAPPSTLPDSLIPQSDSSQFQAELVNKILLSSHFETFPPSPEYRRQFWKWIVEGLETRGEEVDERIYEAYLELLSTATVFSLAPRPPLPSYSTYFWSPTLALLQEPEPSNLKLTTLMQSHTTIEGGTTGLRTWGASLRLGDWLVSHPEVVQSRKVLELGSGASFLGLIIAALQLEKYDTHAAPSLVLTDVNSGVLLRCRDNFSIPCNGMEAHPSLSFRLLDWSEALNEEGNLDDSSSAVTEVLNNTDVIIGADLVYDVTIFPALVAVLALFSRTHQGRLLDSPICAYIALTIRREDTVSKFINHLASHCLKHEMLDLNIGSATQFIHGLEVKDKVKLVKVFCNGQA